MNKEEFLKEEIGEEKVVEVTFEQLMQLYEIGINRIRNNLYAFQPQVDALDNCIFEITESNLLEFTKACLIGSEDDYE